MAGFFKKHQFTTLLISFHLLFLLYKISLGNFFMVDSYEYYQLAKNIWYHGVFYHDNLEQLPLLPEAFTRRPPIYSLFIIISSLFFTSDLFILIFQNCFSILNVLGIKKLFENEGYTISTKWFLVAVLTSVSQLIYPNVIMSEIILQSLIIAFLLFAQKAIKQRSIKYYVATQIVLLLLFLTKPVFYLFVIPNIILSVIFLQKVQLRKVFVLYSLLPVLVLILYCSWNYQRTNNFEMSSIQNHNLSDWNLYFFHVNKYGSKIADSINQDIKNRASQITSYPAKQKFVKDEILTYLKKDWFSYGLFHLRGTIRCFIDPGRFDLYSYFQTKSNMGFMNIINKGDFKLLLQMLPQIPLGILCIMLIIFVGNCIKFLCFIWFWIQQWRQASMTTYLSLIFLLYIVLLTGPLGASRFMVPVLLIYLVMATVGFTDLLQSFRAKRAKHL